MTVTKAMTQINISKNDGQNLFGFFKHPDGRNEVRYESFFKLLNGDTCGSSFC